MKKIVQLITTLMAVFIILAPTTALADTAPKIFIEGNLLKTDVNSVIENGTTLVPMRAIFEALGATIDWNNDTQTVTGTKDDINIMLQINSKEAKRNDETIKLDVPAKLINDSTMVPLRFISEALNKTVEWEGKTSTIYIYQERILFEDQNLKIAYKGIRDSLFDKDILCLIENKSDIDLIIQDRDFSVNGYMVDPIFSSHVAKGKKINDELSLSLSDLKKNNITNIENFEFKFHVFNWDDTINSYETPVITIDLTK